MTRRVLPYRSPSEDVVSGPDWVLVTEDGEVPLLESVPD